MHFILSELSVIAISVSLLPLTLLIYLTSFTFALHSQLVIISFDRNSFDRNVSFDKKPFILTGTHSLRDGKNDLTGNYLFSKRNYPIDKLSFPTTGNHNFRLFIS
jgi:hypothetical protein